MSGALAQPKTVPPGEDVGEEEDEPKYTETELSRLRTKLFKTGSKFRPTVRSEVVGIDNVLVEIDQLIHWLKNSEEYQRYGARLEPGVIFEGEPGTGKTLVSRYIATASEALFINVRDFPHNGSLYKDSDIRDLFARARATYQKENRPIVLFWDEFENSACERSEATPDQAATVSQLTAELDGIHGKNAGILLVGCTNYIYGIDAALRRAGRMGLQIEFHAPDRYGKALLLEYYVNQYSTKGTIDIETLSYFFDDNDTAADIEESCMEAWRVAVYRTLLEGAEPILTQEDLIKVFLKRLVGPPATFVNLPVDDRYRIAVHECGHAIMALVYEIPLRLITVQPGKKSLGRVITANVKDHVGTLEEIVSDMRVGVGSICAEAQAELPPSLGTSQDIDSLSKVATRIVDNHYSQTATGLFKPRAVSEIRKPQYGAGSNPSVSEAAIAASDEDVKAQLRKVESEGRQVMASVTTEVLEEIATHVNERVTLTGAEFEELFYMIAGDPTQFRPKD